MVNEVFKEIWQTTSKESGKTRNNEEKFIKNLYYGNEEE